MRPVVSHRGCDGRPQLGYENKFNEKGERLIWLDPAVVNKLRALRAPGESFSDVILRLARGEVPTLLSAQRPFATRDS
jgi:hypothetical protein